MPKHKTESLLKMLRICADMLSKNPNLGYIETQECFRIMENIIKTLNDKADISPEKKHVLQKFLDELDALHPLSYMDVKTVPFFICKSWVRF